MFTLLDVALVMLMMSVPSIYGCYLIHSIIKKKDREIQDLEKDNMEQYKEIFDLREEVDKLQRSIPHFPKKSLI